MSAFAPFVPNGKGSIEPSARSSRHSRPLSVGLGPEKISSLPSAVQVCQSEFVANSCGSPPSRGRTTARKPSSREFRRNTIRLPLGSNLGQQSFSPDPGRVRGRMLRSAREIVKMP